MAITRGTTTETIYKQIRKNILEGTLLPREKLVTEKLASAYGVSRTPVREALRKLEQDGLVVSEANLGAVIRKLELEEILDIYEIREAIESIAVKKVASLTCEKKLITKLNSLCDTYCNASNPMKASEADFEFHMEICRNSKSKILIDVIENHMIMISSFTMGQLMFPQMDKSRHNQTDKEHRQIIEAIADGNPEAAVKAMSRHLSSAKNAFSRLFVK